MKRSFWRTLWECLRNFLFFFGVIGFVVTCTFLLFFSIVSIPEEDVHAFAPGVFINVLALSLLFFVIDALRRKMTVEWPARKIQKGLQQLTEGDFSTQIDLSSLSDHYQFAEIAASINRLAEELAGVETLRTDFVANVSHELKPPLTVIQNYGTLLQKPGLSEEKRQEYATVILQTSRRLTSLISNIPNLTSWKTSRSFRRPLNTISGNSYVNVYSNLKSYGNKTIFGSKRRSTRISGSDRMWNCYPWCGATCCPMPSNSPNRVAPYPFR